MRNRQRVELPVKTNSQGLVDVHSVFYTIQGEGPFAGEPAVFIRLAGCNLQCPNCDTDYTTKRSIVTPEQLLQTTLARIDSPLRRNQTRPLIVFTGGEPFRQDFGDVVRHFVQNDFSRFQIETNGTLKIPEGFPTLACTIVCSPKADKINDSLWPYLKHLKYVVKAGEISLADGLPTQILGKYLRPARPHKGFTGTVWIQPEDSGHQETNEMNVRECLRIAKEFGYRISLQTHKILGVE